MTVTLDTYAGVVDGDSPIQGVHPSADTDESAIGQTFKPDWTATLSSCKFNLKKVGSPMGVLRARLYAHTGTFGSTGKPTGDVLAESADVTMEGLTTSYVLTTFTFPQTYDVVKDTAYCLVIVAVSATTLDNTTNYVCVGNDGSSPSHDGNVVYYSSSVWGYYAPEDDPFIVYGVNPCFLTKDNYWAQSFTPAKNILSQISLYLGKVGAPTDGLEGGVYADDGSGKPNPDMRIAGFSYDSEYIDAVPSWKPVSAVGNLSPGVKYWIVLNKVGDSTNYYKWCHDALAAGEHAYSADNVTWTLVSSSYEFAFKTQYDRRILLSKEDASTVPVYEWRETVVRDESILDRDTANAYAAALLESLTDETVELSDLTMLNPTLIPPENTYVGVNFNELGVLDDYDVKSIALRWRAGFIGASTLTLVVGRHGDALAEFLANLKLALDRLTVSDLGLDAPVELLRSLTDTMSLTVAEDLSAVESTTTYYITEDFADLDDWVVSSGSWSVSGGVVTQTNTASAHYYLTHDAISLPSTYSLECKFRSRGLEKTRHAVIFRMNDSDASAYYEISVCAWGDYIGLVRCEGYDNEYVFLVYNDPYPTTLNTWYTCRIEQGDDGAGFFCNIYLDGFLVTEYAEDARAAGLGDRVRLHTYNYAVGGLHDWDYIYVWTEA